MRYFEFNSGGQFGMKSFIAAKDKEEAIKRVAEHFKGTKAECEIPALHEKTREISKECYQKEFQKKRRRAYSIFIANVNKWLLKWASFIRNKIKSSNIISTEKSKKKWVESMGMWEAQFKIFICKRHVFTVIRYTVLQYKPFRTIVKYKIRTNR